MTSRLAMDPVIIDAADGAASMRRKEQWYTEIDFGVDWENVEKKLTQWTPWSSTWASDDEWHLLRNPIYREAQPPIQKKGFFLPICLQGGTKLFRLTTPSTQPDGRPTPPRNKSLQLSTERTNHRYPPWQYEEQFLVQWLDGASSTAPLPKKGAHSKDLCFTGESFCCLSTCVRVCVYMLHKCRNVPTSRCKMSKCKDML